MAAPTPEQIASKAEHLNGKANKRAINNQFRLWDDSRLWPINGKFNATERAIRKVRREQSELMGLEYAYALDAEISRIVNEAV
jgi:hypothetical protein